MSTILLELAENDDHGNETGKAVAVHISDAIELEPGMLYGGVTIRRGSNFVKIGRLKMRCYRWATWYGNMCWNAAEISAIDAARVLNYLKKHGWHNVAGWVELGEKYERGEVTAGDLRDAVTAQ